MFNWKLLPVTIFTAYEYVIIPFAFPLFCIDWSWRKSSKTEEVKSIYFRLISHMISDIKEDWLVNVALKLTYSIIWCPIRGCPLKCFVFLRQWNELQLHYPKSTLRSGNLAHEECPEWTNDLCRNSFDESIAEQNQPIFVWPLSLLQPNRRP